MKKYLTWLPLTVSMFLFITYFYIAIVPNGCFDASCLKFSCPNFFNWFAWSGSL